MSETPDLFGWVGAWASTKVLEFQKAHEPEICLQTPCFALPAWTVNTYAEMEN